MGRRHGAFLASKVTRSLGWLLLAAGCGRIGVELLTADAGLDAGNQVWSTADAETAACFATCENPHGSAECSTGSCVLGCSIGYADCDTLTANGCETDTATALDTCGGCSNPCTNEHGSTACRDGICAPVCVPGFADCDGNPSNGCEANLAGVSSCASCGVHCSNEHGDTSCTDGVCVPICVAGYEDCDGNPANGCEARTSSDPRHCGSCTNACDLASQVCSAGVCELSPCPAGSGECDDDIGTVCETDLTSSASDCGFCDNVCSAANGSAACQAGSCVVTGCGAGYADCDTDLGNGCEALLASDSGNCGACRTACSNAHGSTSCAASRCAPICSTGYGDCDSSRPNGCETSLDTPSNCGTCGNACPANGGTPACERGVCTTHCDLTGVFALRLSVPVDWPAGSVIEPGSGTFTFWSKLQITQTGTGLFASVQMCGQTVPDFAPPILPETYGIVYPNALFDATPEPATASTGILGGLAPGATFTLARSALVLGVTFPDPVNAAWPSASSVPQVDSDGDGEPGVTAQYKSGGGYSAVPVNPLATSRAAVPYMAMRVVFSLSGTLTSCSRSNGAVASDDIDSHTLDCRLTNGRDCSSTEANYLDTNTPNFTTRAGSYEMLKVANTAGCAEVRAALP